MYKKVYAGDSPKRIMHRSWALHRLGPLYMGDHLHVCTNPINTDTTQLK